MKNRLLSFHSIILYQVKKKYFITNKSFELICNDSRHLSNFLVKVKWLCIVPSLVKMELLILLHDWNDIVITSTYLELICDFDLDSSMKCKNM